MKNNDNKATYDNKFLLIPKPKEDEFILSYLNRIKEENAYPSLNLVLKIIFGDKIKILAVVKGEFNKLTLSKYVGINENLIDKLCITDKNKFYCVSCILVCPYCITENKYVPISGYQKNAMCPTHSVPYISRCPHCNKLLDWNAKKIEKCHFCKNYINSNIEQYIVRYAENLHHSDIYLIFNIFLKLTINSPSRNEFYNLEYLSIGLQKSVDFINDPEKIILERFRKIFLQIKVIYPNFKAIRYEFFLLIFNIIKIFNEIHDGSRIINCLYNIIDVNFINQILKNYNQEFHHFLNNYNQSFEAIKIEFSVENLCNILNLECNVTNALLNTRTLMWNKNKKIDLNDFIHFCKSISRSLNIDDVDDFVYLRNLRGENQKKIFNSFFYSIFYFYNFSYNEMLYNIKIKKTDLNHLFITVK